MKDDIASLHGQPPSSFNTQELPKKHSKYEVKKELSPIPQRATHMRHMSGLIIRASIGFVAILALITGAWFAYTNIHIGNNPKSLSSTPLEIADVIPRSVMGIVTYDVSNADNRSTITSLWGSEQQQAGQNPINGNPTAILSVGGIQAVYFFTLPGDSMPFLIVKSTTESKQFLSQLSDVKYVENGGWLIAHASSIDSYISEVAKESFASSSDAPLLSGNGFVARYIISPSSVPQIFSLPSNMTVNSKQLVFDINQPPQNNVIQSQYTLSETAVPSAVIPDTTQLASLIPNDPHFLRVGSNFFEDISSFQNSTSSFDPTIFKQPAIQQFIAQLTTPYALYTRTGADGVADTGLIVQLPSNLIAKLGHQSQVVEDLLTSFAPFVTGRQLHPQIVFGDSSDGPIPIRYANLEGQTASLDYTIGDNYILISSSREGMHALSAMAAGQNNSMLQNDPWAQLIKAAPSFVPSDMVTGSIADPAMLSLLPKSSTDSTISIVISTKKDNTGITTHATLSLHK
ncbi:MAG TPA: hypothetical protein VLG69_00275 [Candidatus Andersenbacteria bacterium]|nr:hypothetical protein [Candidatus Andersenbacteria bacterium]